MRPWQPARQPGGSRDESLESEPGEAPWKRNRDSLYARHWSSVNRRLPRQLWLLPWANLHFPREATALVNRFPDDILHCPAFLQRPCRTQGVRYLPGTYVDEWGCTFTSLQTGIIGQVKTPLITDWSEVESVRPPVEALDLDVARINGFCRQTDRFVLGGCCPRPFERLQFLCGAERVYVGLARRTGTVGLLRTCTISTRGSWRPGRALTWTG